MELTTLKYMRKIVPGTLLIFFGAPFYMFFFDDSINMDSSLKFVLDGYGVTLAAILGFIYDGTDLRKLRLSAGQNAIKLFIAEKIIAGLGVSVRKGKIKKNMRSIMSIYYDLIDHDDSLKEKSLIIKDNGLFWTSSADTALIGCFYAWIYALLGYYYDNTLLFLLPGLLIGCIAFLSGNFLYPKSIEKHMSVVDDQIALMLEKYNTDLNRRLLPILL
ncbi:hypothetical protein C4K68_07655 [Pokkaliibacter plantistimulans]|uniref:Uncharacterized protein n=1 Tax=Proteobacteria bacterium 228 TaxID=2083153 RepID=A0A2S5KTC5_9PROT|nr:hypothetical protein [Pokkaliibacter plantistimulans]PPC77912.1 hypothetical protein C4K68_07655 [Pokkaliibacter plantistimulans]